MYVQLTWHCSPYALAMLEPHPGSPWCSEGHSQWVRVSSFSREGDQTEGVAARLLLPSSELGNPHLSLGLLLHEKGWVLESGPVVWSQGGADSPCKEEMSSLKNVLFVSGQLLHVAIVCAGHNASRDVVTLVKSILFHR